MSFDSKQSIPIKSLLSMPRGAPLSTAALKASGISTALGSYYAKSGWLTRLERGVFMLPGDELKRDTTLAFLATRVPGLHVGGKTALAWWGVRHNLPVREQLCLWGDPTKLPGWFTERFPSRYVSRHLFGAKLPRQFALLHLPETPDGPLVAAPERALLEMLSDVGISQGTEEARQIMEGLRSIREDVMATLMKQCQRIKVIRLCVQWAEELQLPWAPAVRAMTKNRTGKSRWSARLKDGTTLTLKP
jgi:hypothetical protein